MKNQKQQKRKQTKKKQNRNTTQNNSKLKNKESKAETKSSVLFDLDLCLVLPLRPKGVAINEMQNATRNVLVEQFALHFMQFGEGGAHNEMQFVVHFI